MYGNDITYEIQILKEKCEGRLNELYPRGIPEDIIARYNWEFDMALEMGDIDELYVYFLISNEAHRLNMPLFIGGNQRSSLLVFLLGYSMINPVKSHYYCEHCGHFEYINDSYFGLDAKDRVCPSCNHMMRKDGLSFYERLTLGPYKSFYFEYYVAKEFYAFARKRLQKEYPDNEIHRAALDEWQEGTVSGHKNDTGFVILPQGKTLDDYPERIVYMKDGERGYFEPINNIEPLGLFVVRFFIDSVCETIYRLQMNTGIYFFDIRQEDISGFIWRDILNTQMCREDEDKFMIEYKPHSYYEMAEVMCASNDSWYDNAKRNGDEKKALWKRMKEADFCRTHHFYNSRDSLFRLLIEFGNSEDESYRFMDWVRKGGARNYWPEKLNKIVVSDDVRTACEKYGYLCMQSKMMEILIGYAICAYYQ